MSENSIIKDVIKEARTYLGTPWVHQGRTRKGVDCVGFIVLAFAKFNIPIYELKGYSRHPDGVLLRKTMSEQDHFKEVYNIQEGDVLLFRIRREPQHVGLVTNSNTADFGIIHSYNGGVKKVIEHDLADYWKKRIVAIYRLK